jgi:hypothetical protein
MIIWRRASRSPIAFPQRLNSVGITGMLDAMVSPEGLAVYDKLLARRQLTVRTTLAQFYDPEAFRSAAGEVDYGAMIAQASAIRAKYADNPLVRADTVKLFADGVLEGNPYAVPPTLPDSPRLKPFLQPIFGFDADGRATVDGLRRHGIAALHRGARRSACLRCRRRHRGIPQGSRLPSGAVCDRERASAARPRDDPGVLPAFSSRGLPSAYSRDQ